MKDVVVVVEIARPPAEVFAVLEDAERNPEWLSGMRSARWTSPAPIRAGSTYEQEASFLGKEIRTSFEVTRHEPGRLITIASRAGSTFPIEVTRLVEPTGAGSRVTETVVSDPSGAYAVAAPVLHRLVRSRIAKDYRRLKALLEAS